LAAGEGTKDLSHIQVEERTDALDRMPRLGVLAEAGANHLLHRTGQLAWGLLRQEGYPQPRTHDESTRIGFASSGQDFQEGGFTFPIPADQPNAFSCLDLQVRIIQEGAVAEEDPEILAADQGHDEFVLGKAP